MPSRLPRTAAKAPQPLAQAQTERIYKYTPAEQSRWQKQKYDELMTKDLHPSGFFAVGHSGISLLTGRWEPDWNTKEALAKTNLSYRTIENILGQRRGNKRESAKTKATELPIGTQKWRDGSEVKTTKRPRESHHDEDLVVIGGNAFSGFIYGPRPSKRKAIAIATAPVPIQPQVSRRAQVAVMKPEAPKADYIIAAEVEWKKERFKWQMNSKKTMPSKEQFIEAFLKKRHIVIPKPTEIPTAQVARTSRTPPESPRRFQRSGRVLLEAMEATAADLRKEGIIDDMFDEEDI